MSRISDNIGKNILKKRSKAVNRQKSVQNFKLAKSAVIVFDTSLENCFPPIKDFTKFLKKEGIKTSVFGYVPQKEIPQEMLLWANFEFITKKDRSWFGSPKGTATDLFFKEAPDMLFIFSLEENLTLEYLTQLSNAKFKIGCFKEGRSDLDLMINPGDKACSIDYFIEQVKHYVNILTPVN